MIVLLVMLVGCLHAAALMNAKKSNVNTKMVKRNAYESNEDDGGSSWDDALVLSSLLQKRLEKRFPKWRSYAIAKSNTNNDHEKWDPEDPFKNAGAYNHESRKAWQSTMDEKRKLYRKMYG